MLGMIYLHHFTEFALDFLKIGLIYPQGIISIKGNNFQISYWLHLFEFSKVKMTKFSKIKKAPLSYGTQGYGLVGVVFLRIGKYNLTRYGDNGWEDRQCWD